jgi:hypothetical protein
MNLADIQIHNTLGDLSLEVNGEDISPMVRSFTLHSDPGLPTILTLQVVGHSTVFEGKGVVRVVEDQVDPTEFIVDFLKNVDPRELSNRVLSELSMSDDTIEKCLQVLCQWAQGES